MSRGAVSKILGEGHLPRADTCAAIARGARCNAHWLLTGEGEAFPTAVSDMSFPVFDTAGGAHWRIAENVEPYERSVPGSMIGFKIEGTSMEPLARDGQLVLALRDVRPGNGDLAVIEFKDGTYSFRRVYLDGKQWMLLAINPAHDPEIRQEREILRAMKVWGVKF